MLDIDNYIYIYFKHREINMNISYVDGIRTCKTIY